MVEDGQGWHLETISNTSSKEGNRYEKEWRMLPEDPRDLCCWILAFSGGMAVLSPVAEDNSETIEIQLSQY